MVCLRKHTREKIGNVYYWGANVFIVSILTLLAISTPTFQIGFKDSVAQIKQKKIESQTVPENNQPSPENKQTQEQPSPENKQPQEQKTPENTVPQEQTAPENKPTQEQTVPQK